MPGKQWTLIEFTPVLFYYSYIYNILLISPINCQHLKRFINQKYNRYLFIINIKRSMYYSKLKEEIKKKKKNDILTYESKYRKAAMT